jgi:hypothetical protein
VKEWLTPQEVGALIGFSAQFVRDEIKAGELHAERIYSRGGKMAYWRIERDQAVAYIARIRRHRSTQRTPETHDGNGSPS